jgi:hypothetical protein
LAWQRNAPALMHMGCAGQWLIDEAARLFPKAFQ